VAAFLRTPFQNSRRGPFKGHKSFGGCRLKDSSKIGGGGRRKGGRGVGKPTPTPRVGGFLRFGGEVTEILGHLRETFRSRQYRHADHMRKWRDLNLEQRWSSQAFLSDPLRPCRENKCCRATRHVLQGRVFCAPRSQTLGGYHNS
jgi:hypothetical protein